MKYTYTVALQSDKIHSHRNGFVTISVQCFDVIQQVSKELIAPLEHTEGHNVMATHLLHHISSQSFGPTEIKISNLIEIKLYYLKKTFKLYGNSLAVQGLGLHVFIDEGLDLIPGKGT